MLLKPTPGFETKMKAAIMKVVKDRELLQKSVDRERELTLEFQRQLDKRLQKEFGAIHEALESIREHAKFQAE